MALAEAQALAQDNQSIPPSYSEAASKPNLRLSISAHSQATIPFMSVSPSSHNLTVSRAVFCLMVKLLTSPYGLPF